MIVAAGLGMTRGRASLAPMLALLLLVAGACTARGGETSVPFDRAGTTRVLRPIRVKQLRVPMLDSLLAPHAGYSSVRLFVQDDSTYTLEINTLRENATQRATVALTAAQVDSLRQTLEARLAVIPKEPEPLDERGQHAFLAQNTGLGLMFYAPAVPYALNLRFGIPAIGAYVVTAGAGFIVPWLASTNHTITGSMASLSLYGSTRGLAHGLLVSDPMSRKPITDADRREAVTTAMCTSVGEGIAGYLWARSNGLSAGTTATIETCGDFGFMWGYAIDMMGGSSGFEWNHNRSLAMVGGSWSGLVLGHTLGSYRDYSYGDALVMRNAGYLGMLVGATVCDLTQRPHHRDPRVYATGLLTGSLLGLAYGDRQVKDYTFSPSDGTSLQIGCAAGALMGLGVVALTNSKSSRGYLIGATTGTLVGYHVTYGSVTRRIRRPKDDPTSWRLELLPTGAWAALHDSPSREDGTVPPLVRLSARF